MNRRPVLGVLAGLPLLAGCSATGLLYVAGHSAGAYSAAQPAPDRRWLGKLGRQADRTGQSGRVLRFLPIINPDVKPVFNRPGLDDPAPADSQPLRHVSAAAPRSLPIAAREDDLVNPQRNTGGVAQALRGAGVAVDVRYCERVNHLTLVGASGRPLRGLAPVIDGITRFVLNDGRNSHASR